MPGARGPAAQVVGGWRDRKLVEVKQKHAAELPVDGATRDRNRIQHQQPLHDRDLNASAHRLLGGGRRNYSKAGQHQRANPPSSPRPFHSCSPSRCQRRLAACQAFYLFIGLADHDQKLVKAKPTFHVMAPKNQVGIFLWCLSTSQKLAKPPVFRYCTLTTSIHAAAFYSWQSDSGTLVHRAEPCYFSIAKVHHFESIFGRTIVHRNLPPLSFRTNNTIKPSVLAMCKFPCPSDEAVATEGTGGLFLTLGRLNAFGTGAPGKNTPPLIAYPTISLTSFELENSATLQRAGQFV